MFTRNTRLVGFVLGFLILLVGGAVGVWSATSSSATAGDSKESKVKALLKERHATLREVADLFAADYRDGRGSMVQVHEANQAMHRAELDLSENAKDRVAVLEKMLAEAREYEKSAAQQQKAGAGTAGAALRAKADRLEAEIALERARAK